MFISTLLLDTAALGAFGLLAAIQPAPRVAGGWLCAEAARACAVYDALPTTARHMQWALFAGAAAMIFPLARPPTCMPACTPACLPTPRLLAVWQTIFWLNRTRNLLSNITTNERYNRKRYPHFKTLDGGFYNPFDRGVAANCHTFFCPGVLLEMEASDGLLGRM